MQNESIKIIRRSPIFLLIFLAMYLGAACVRSYSGIDKPVRINVNVGRNLAKTTYKKQYLQGNMVITGLQGEVFWKPKSYKESFALRYIVNDNSLFSLFDFVCAIIITGIFYWMVYDIEIGDLFSRKIITGTYLISITIILYLFLINFIKYYVVNYFLKDITDNLFRVDIQDMKLSGLIAQLVVVFLFVFVPRIITKARQLEDDQNLTI